MRTKKDRETYIRQYDFLVLEACRRYRKRIDPDDCYVIAQIALMDAIEHYHQRTKSRKLWAQPSFERQATAQDTLS